MKSLFPIDTPPATRIAWFPSDRETETFQRLHLTQATNMLLGSQQWSAGVLYNANCLT